jgi:LysM repeat protein
LILKILALPTRAQRLQSALEEGASILSANLKIAERRFPAAGALRHMQAAIAAYNCGFGNITDINNPDAKTTGGDYSGDVIGRMLLLSRAGVLGSNFSGGGTTPPPPPNNNNTPPPPQPQTPSGRTYTVVAGDTGGRIAQKLDVTLNALAAANPGVDWTRLRIGQSLNVPGGGSSSGGGSTPTPPTPVQPSNDIRLLDTHRAQVEALLQQVTSLVRAYPLQTGQALLLTGTQANLLQNFVNRANDLILTYNGANQAQRQLFDNKYPNYIRTTQEQRDWLRNSYMPHVRTSSPQQTSRPSLQGSVGRNAQNLRADALLVQELLNKHGFPVSTDGAIGPKTIAAIEAFQRQKLGISNPDGRIEPNGSDWFGLIA